MPSGLTQRLAPSTTSGTTRCTDLCGVVAKAYVAYRKAGYSKKFYEAHTADILLHKAAKDAFDELGVKKLPTVKSLQIEYAATLAEKKKLYAEFVAVRAEMKEVQTAKANVDALLGITRAEHEKKNERKQR